MENEGANHCSVMSTRVRRLVDVVGTKTGMRARAQGGAEERGTEAIVSAGGG
jgi:hypothetical protein